MILSWFTFRIFSFYLEGHFCIKVVSHHKKSHHINKETGDVRQFPPEKFFVRPSPIVHMVFDVIRDLESVLLGPAPATTTDHYYCSSSKLQKRTMPIARDYSTQCGIVTHSQALP
jgi:hypothetical protein